jgi:hypothetical protein
MNDRYYYIFIIRRFLQFLPYGLLKKLVAGISGINLNCL